MNNTMPPNKGSELIDMLLDTARQSNVDLRDRVSNVRDAPIDVAIAKSCECIQFELEGKTYLGELRGRNRDLCINPLDAQAEANRAIAVRVLLDRNVTVMESTDSAVTSEHPLG